MATWHRFTAAGRTVRAVSFVTAMQGAPTTRRRGWSHIAASAAVAVLTVGLGWCWQHQPPSSFDTGIGKQASITLPDGSTLQLNSNSPVHVVYYLTKRDLRPARAAPFFTV